MCFIFKNVFICQAASSGMQGSGMNGHLDFAIYCIYIYLKQTVIYTV